MTLPKTLIAALALFLANCGRTADDGGRDWTAQIQVFDEALDPIAGADVTVGFYVTPNPGEATGVDRITGKTNEKGVFNASHRDRSFDITIAASKVGYYKSRKKHELGHPLQADQDKLHPIITLTLRTNLHPIPMYAKKIFNGPPVFNEEVGYDLVVGDWVAPHGKGKQKDFIFLGQLQKKSNEEFDYKLVIKFANPSDGIQEFQVPADLTSELRSPYEAPDSGYEREVVRRLSRKPGQGTKNDADKNRNFFFRVRTVLDPNGNIQSANYGKIYGDFMDFTYFFNPEVNSRNLEFNPSKNLFGNLPPSERVEEP